MFNSKDNSNNNNKQNISMAQHTAARTNSGGSMLQSDSLSQQRDDSGTGFFRVATSLDDVSIKKEEDAKKDSVNERKPISFENETTFFRPAEIFIDSSEFVSEDETENSSLTDENIKEYTKFKKQRLQLSEILNHSALLINELNMDKFTQKLKSLGNRIESRDFKIQIVGTFKNGKSTFINSFLGEEVLPAYALPCTAVINEVKYGEKKRAVLHFKNPVPDILPKELSAKALEHMKKHKMKNIPPMEIPYNDIESFVVIPMGKDPREMLLESPYERVELFWPMQLLESGIEIIDSPGLNEHSTRTKVTMDYIAKADAVIFVLNATALCSMEEMNFIENHLAAQGFSDLFFVVNRFDMIPDKEKERIMKFAVKKLEKLTSFGSEGIFFISAKDALDAKKETDCDKLHKSGLPAFESSLSGFLTLNRGRSRLYLTAQKLRKLLTEEIIGKIIPRRKAMLETSIEDLNEKYQSIAPKLKLLETKKEFLQKKILYTIDQCNVDFKQMAQKHIFDIIALIPDWVNDFTTTTKVGMIPNQEKIKEVLDEISAHLARKIEGHNKEWQEKTLFPAIQEKGTAIFESAEKEIRTLAEEVYNTASTIPGANISDNLQSQIMGQEQLSPASFDYDKVKISRNISARVTGESLLVILSFLNTATIVSLFAVNLMGGNKDPKSGILTKIKEQVTNEVTKNLSNTAYEFIDSVADNISECYTNIAEKLLEPADFEIREIRNQMEAAISDIEKGEESAKRKQLILSHAEIKLKSICIALENYASSVRKEKSIKKL